MKNFKRILLIDDDPIQNLINTKLLNRIEFSERIDVAINGRLARDEYLLIDDPLPEIIFLDINMPIMNGWEFLDLLKDMELPHLPDVYMLTSSISPEDIKQSDDHPMVKGYITKPLNLDKLIEIKDQFFD